MLASLVAFAILLLQSIPFCISLNVSFTTRDLLLRHCMCLSWSWVIHRLEHWPLRHRSLYFVCFDSRQTKVADRWVHLMRFPLICFFPRICPTIFHQSLINFLQSSNSCDCPTPCIHLLLPETGRPFQPKCKVYNTVMKVVFITATCCWRFQKYLYTHFMMSCVETSQMDLRFDVTHGCRETFELQFQMSLIVIIGKLVWRCTSLRGFLQRKNGAMSSGFCNRNTFCASSSPSFLGCGTSFFQFEGRKFWTLKNPCRLSWTNIRRILGETPATFSCQDLLDLLDAAKAAHLPDIRKVRNWGVTCEGGEHWMKVQHTLGNSDGSKFKDSNLTLNAVIPFGD